MPRLHLLLLLPTAILIDWSMAFLPHMTRTRTYRSRLQNSSPDLAVLQGEIEMQLNGENRYGTSRVPSSGVQLTAYQILHPYLFSPGQPGADISRPLDNAFRILKQALEQIATTDMKFVLQNADAAQVLRIEHVVSHTVDPLCWLHAQTETDEPVIFFSNAEQTLEAAVFGAAYIHRGAANEDLWDMFRILPEESHMYGGERFDREMEPDAEWKDFGSGMWMLPALEMRRKTTVAGDNNNKSNSTTTVAIHVMRNADNSWAVEGPLKILSKATHHISEAVPPTNLPPVISRDGTYGPDLDSQEVYERGVTAALEQFTSSNLEKVVLARRSNLILDKTAHKVSALDILRKWKFGGNEGGHLFYLRPAGSSHEFFGCTPEQLFRVSGNKVITEALAGTRPRGSTQDADVALSRDLVQSSKDRAENEITGRFIRSQLHRASCLGLTRANTSILAKDEEDRYFVRRLLHLQHICQRFECDLEQGVTASSVAQFLFHSLHPTPAVCGFPIEQAAKLIRSKESIAFDRGYYSGPFGYIGIKDAEIVVAIRSGLVSTSTETGAPIVSVYAGAGIVPGSTVQGEWAETSYKLNVVSTLFPQSPITLLSSPNANVAWATAFIEELIRCGVRRFYVCPGSRSTPLVVALAKALRSHVGVVQAHSVHDERGAAFRAVGYGRARGRPAAVITSSGTATANMYPAIMEAGMDGIPLLVVTADRPYENRHSGANQAVDQVKAYSSTYIRWFRDIPPPNDEIPVSIALSDANHAVKMTLQQRGPVHVNIQFRENLAPDAGAVRNDNRVDSVTKFNGFRFTDVPKFHSWSRGGDQWIRSYRDSTVGLPSVKEIVKLLRSSRRGLIVVGSLRGEPGQHTEIQVEAISDFAQAIGFPIFAGIQSGSLRSRSSAVIPYAEHLLKNHVISKNIRPDLIIQIGHPLVSTEVPKMIIEAMKVSETRDDQNIVRHILIHPHHPEERSDPDFTLTQCITTEVAPFLRSVLNELDNTCDVLSTCSSELSSLVLLGRMLAKEMPKIIEDASNQVTGHINSNIESSTLTEPQVVLAMSQTILKNRLKLPLFLSNSMAVRDSEFFLYPNQGDALGSVGVNRGASGIDGIISSATGYAEANDKPVVLLIGDLAALHDINSFHALSKSHASSANRSPPVKTVIVNNDGGGIFSFLPIAKHGNDVGFEEFFGTPTNTFSFQNGAEAFGLSFESANRVADFRSSFESSLLSSDSTIVEARVVSREVNVAVHSEITSRANEYLSRTLQKAVGTLSTLQRLHIRLFSSSDTSRAEKSNHKTLLLIHGWMGDNTEWEDVGLDLVQRLPPDWSIVAIDLPGHGDSSTAEMQSVLESLGLRKLDEGIVNKVELNLENSVDSLAQLIMRSLVIDHGIKRVNAVAGYSLGGRVAMAMNRICKSNGGDAALKVMNDETRLILLGSYPGKTQKEMSELLQDAAIEKTKRLATDRETAKSIRNLKNRLNVAPATASSKYDVWSNFLNKWYRAPIWGNLHSEKPILYRKMLEKRARSLSSRAGDMASVLEHCSPGLGEGSDWKYVDPANTLFIAGEMDAKYLDIGREWKNVDTDLHFESIPNAGHALLTEAPFVVGEQISKFLMGNEKLSTDAVAGAMQPSRREIPVVVTASEQDTNIQESTDGSPTIEVLDRLRPVTLDYEAFAIDMIIPGRQEKGVVGIGWGDKAHAIEDNRIQQRRGFVIQLVSNDGAIAGIGEVSPLHGLHIESLDEAKGQLSLLRTQLKVTTGLPTIDPIEILSLRGGLGKYLTSLLETLGVGNVSPSVRSGLEMALISFSSQALRKPVLNCLSQYVTGSILPLASLPLNGLVTRDLGISTFETQQQKDGQHIRYSSLKVKVGHQDAALDAVSVAASLQQTSKLRPDANQAWTESDALNFSAALNEMDLDMGSRIEFVEEPIQKVSGNWTLRRQLELLERWYQHSGIQFGLDESISDLVHLHNGDFERIRADMTESFDGISGCGALVLKPALLGFELSMRIAKLAHEKLSLNVVFSCAFDSGVGLAYTAFLAAVSDLASGQSQQTLLAHGIGTFDLLDGDTLSPPFASYVNEKGILHVASLSRAFFGLGLDEMRGAFSSQLPDEDTSTSSSDYRASAATSSSGRKISLVVSLSLPFSDDVASARFSDLPQQSRWSPWLSSVTYLDDGRETEWTLNVRGVKLSWRAVSSILNKPYKGIQWESVSGVKNLGMAEFVPMDSNSCMMKVRMTIVAPRIVATLFPGASVLLEDFLQNKLLKWSLEMFRDVVKGDLALERGDVELGDALFGAVEGRANAIEASLSNPLITGADVNGRTNGGSE